MQALVQTYRRSAGLVPPPEDGATAVPSSTSSTTSPSTPRGGTDETTPPPPLKRRRIGAGPVNASQSESSGDESGSRPISIFRQLQDALDLVAADPNAPRSTRSSNLSM